MSSQQKQKMEKMLVRETQVADIESIVQDHFDKRPNSEHWENMVLDMVDHHYTSAVDFGNKLRLNSKKYNCVVKKSDINYQYWLMRERGDVKSNKSMEKYLFKVGARSWSGVTVVTVLTTPELFSCPENCHYCPNQKDMPRSYDRDEPACRRATANNFDPVLQFNDRIRTLIINGHPIDKIVVLILGGTWSFYPREYREWFNRKLFYAANCVGCRESEQPIESDDINVEQVRNESAKARLIEVCVETRPDWITHSELRFMRRLGITRIQMGLQHTDDGILKIVNRNCTDKQNRAALRLAKTYGFKTDVHLMPDLPGSSIEKDENMIQQVLTHSDYEPDYLKLYPTKILNDTEIKKWYDSGEYIQYADTDPEGLIEMLIRAKQMIKRRTRLNRLERDFPTSSLMGGMKFPNLRQELLKRMDERKLTCKCIRCREVKNKDMDPNDVHMHVDEFIGSGAKEYYISYENKDKSVLYGFIRLRINNKLDVPKIKALHNSLIVRELHVYGQHIRIQDPISYRHYILVALYLCMACMVVSLNSYFNSFVILLASLLIINLFTNSGTNTVQHSGLGRRLVFKSEEIAKQNGLNKVCIIAGVGTRNYYRKWGYELEDTYMVRYF